MKPRALAWSFLLVAAAPAARAADEVVDLSAEFAGWRAALVVREVGSGRTLRHDPRLAATRLSPCSTFKIPNSLIGLETGVVADASSVLPWDGRQRAIREWNRDHDLRSAIRHSAVWYYQELARRVGPRRMQHWVSALGYGNEDTSGGVDRFWLGSTLRVSADEQVAFLERLHAGTLPFSARSVAVVKDILLQDPPPAAGLVYRGKTGSCQAGAPEDAHGWWVGSVEGAGRVHVFAAVVRGRGASGRACRPLAEAALRRLGVLPVERRRTADRRPPAQAPDAASRLGPSRIVGDPGEAQEAR